MTMRQTLSLCLLLLVLLAALPAGAAEPLLPFFDRQDEGAADPAPPPPGVTPLDQAVLDLCGAFGARPRAAAFRRMLDQADVAPEVAAIQAATMPGSTRTAFKAELSAAWFKAGGFVHVFCGEPGRRTLGGLHFAPRYLELQQEGLAGRLPRQACGDIEIVPPIYTFGVRYRLPDGRLQEACPKGYALGLTAADILADGLNALHASRRGDMCLANVAPREGRPFKAVFVARGGGIRTFYPDATPACDAGSGAAGCACGG